VCVSVFVCVWKVCVVIVVCRAIVYVCFPCVSFVCIKLGFCAVFVCFAYVFCLCMRYVVRLSVRVLCGVRVSVCVVSVRVFA